MRADQNILAARLPRTTGRSAFTLVELIVSMGGLLILMTVLAQLFYSTRKVTSVGVARGEAANYARATEALMRSDMRAIEQTGFIVIRMENRIIGDASSGFRRYAADQIAFIAGGSFDTAYEGFIAGATNVPWYRDSGGRIAPLPPVDMPRNAPAARVWYGHINTDGWNTPVAASWSLGRQALLLNPSQIDVAVDTAGNKLYPDVEPLFPLPYSVFDPGLFDRDQRAYPTSPTQRMAENLQSIQAALQLPYRVFDIDVANTDLAAVRREIMFDDADAPRSALDQLIKTAEVCQRIPGAAWLPSPNSTLPDGSTSPPMSYERMMEIHALLAPSAPSFRVEFAGDYLIQPEGSGRDAWQAGQDGRIDVIDTDPKTELGYVDNIRWYGLDVQPSPSNPDSDVGIRSAFSEAEETDPGAASLWPQLDVIERDGKGKGDQWTVVFGLDQTVTPWPKLLRVTTGFYDSSDFVRSQQQRKGQPPKGIVHRFIVAVGKQ